MYEKLKELIYINFSVRHYSLGRRYTGKTHNRK